MSLYERIQKLCALKGVSKNQMERDIGISKGSANKWTSSFPNAEVLQRVAQYFNVSMEYLTTGEEKEGGETYYLNDETREIAQEIFENKELKSLFDMSRKMPPERLRAHMEFMKKLYDQEHPSD